MALAFGANIYDGQRLKICTITCLDNDVAADLAVDFTTAGMTDFQGAVVPVEASLVVTTSTDISLDFALTTILATGFTIRKLTAGGAGGAVTVRVMLRNPRGIAA